MTRDEIKNIDAGDELNALIEQVIFGRTLTKEKPASYVKMANGYSDLRFNKKYSSDISDAWIVLLKFPEVYIEYKDVEYFVMIGDNFGTAVHNKSAPLAICRAALLAVMK